MLAVLVLPRRHLGHRLLHLGVEAVVDEALDRAARVDEGVGDEVGDPNGLRVESRALDVHLGLVE